MIVGIEVLQLIGLRLPELIVLLAVSLATALLAGRAFGVLTQYEWIPKLGRRSRERKRSSRGSGKTVVAGPWAGANTTNPRDQYELDALLDKISANGIDSLARGEKARLNELSKKLRGQ